jgi:translocation and assembly module TamB
MLSPLAEAFPIPGHRIAGEASASLDVGGTLGRPVVKGTMSIRDGRYENLFTGMVLSNVTLDGEGSDERIQLRLHAGGAGKSDRLEGSGAIVLDRDKGFPLNLALSISELAAVRRDDLSAVVSGRLSLEDSLEKPLLRGEIETRRGDWRIGEPLPPSVVEVEVTEVGGNDNEKPPTGPNSGTPKGDLRLDVAVRIPGGAYIRGRGLDSEWRGTLGVRGSVRNPSVTGALEHVRGQFEFAGKVFKLVRGSITFAQGDEIDPAIDLRAEHTVKSLKAAVDATGTVSRPVVALSSVPQMPRDEILSRILFGKGVGQLTQLETAQLAVAIASVTGLDGGGLGLIDRLRRNVGVDVLRVGSDTAGAPTAVVGKNISDEVYVGVEQGTAANSGKVQVELEVLPGLKLKSGVAAEAQGSLGIEFRWDY